MARRILILGASYGSLLGTKLIMAGHDVTLVCRHETARLINREGTKVRIRLKGEDTDRTISSKEQPGRMDAATPQTVNPAQYDLIALAMQEPQYAAPEIRILMRRIARVEVPCLSIMNMPPLPYLNRLGGLDIEALEPAYTDASIWDLFQPGLVTMCSPDPQAVRPAGEGNNVLQVGLPTNFKAAGFENPDHTIMLARLANDIENVRLDGKEVPVKLRVHRSLFVPLAKWAMLLTGNYRCLSLGGQRAIAEAVSEDLAVSKSLYNFVNAINVKLGANPQDHVPFEKYAGAAKSLQKPSSVARAVGSGALNVERVDRLVQMIGEQIGMRHPLADAVVRVTNARLTQNEEAVMTQADTRTAA